ncbi:T9SS type A sorting domain-containing protein [candidate division KSB1 bacterium]|nr:T9SS type A sorting domain-containing protein [candidate division KSB1 bacterium]
MKHLIIIPLVFVLVAGTLFVFSTCLFADGTEPTGTPREVSILDHLLWISTNSSSWGDDFTQTANIDASSTSTWDDGDGGDAEGFTPIGNSTTQFTGSYNGNGNTISGLYINRSGHYIGLFGSINTATVQNLGATSVNITGQYQVGGLMGKNSGTLSNCYSTGSVSGNTQSGGLVGDNSGTMSNCYSRSSVTGSSETGGLIGINMGTVSNCYCTGSVPGSGSVGGLISYHIGTVTDSFWDTQTSGTTTGIHTGSTSGTTGKTTVEMKDHDTFTDEVTAGLMTAWDFETNPNDDVANNDYWDMDYSQTINNGYPYLSWQDGGSVSLPVELTSFSARCVRSSIVIEWITESEVDNLGFILERKSDDDWQEIASYQTYDALLGQGNTSSRTEYEFKDESVLPGETYSYRLSDVDIKGNVNIYDVISILVDPLPEETLLESAFPNPFNPKTKISYHLAESGRVQIVVYDMLGRKVNTLLNEEQTAGSYKIYWHGKDDFGKQTSSGTYILRMIAGDVVKSQKVLLMR